MAKVVFSNHETKKRSAEASSMINGSLNKDFNMVSGFKSPRSQAPYKTTSKERGGFFA